MCSHYKTIFYTLIPHNYLSTEIIQVIICVFILIKVDKIIMINHIVNMRDEKEYLKLNINLVIKWWIPFKCRWIEEFITYSCKNEM
jgi:hypothetical protein